MSEMMTVQIPFKTALHPELVAILTVEKLPPKPLGEWCVFRAYAEVNEKHLRGTVARIFRRYRDLPLTAKQVGTHLRLKKPVAYHVGNGRMEVLPGGDSLGLIDNGGTMRLLCVEIRLGATHGR